MLCPVKMHLERNSDHKHIGLEINEVELTNTEKFENI